MHLQEVDLLLEARDLSLALVLIECLLGNKLSSEVLDLESILSFDGFVFLAHDLAPDYVHFVQDLGHASLVHFALELVLDLLDLLDSGSRDPLVGISCRSSGLGLVSLDTEAIANSADALFAEIPSFLEDLVVITLLVVAGLSEELNKFFVISFHVVELDMDGSFSLS